MLEPSPLGSETEVFVSRWKKRVQGKKYQRRPQDDSKRRCVLCKREFGASTVHVVKKNSPLWEDLRIKLPEAARLEEVAKKLKVCCRHFVKDHPKRIKDIKWITDGSQGLPWFCSFQLQDTSSKRVTRREFDAALQKGEQQSLELKRKEKTVTPHIVQSSQKKQRLIPSTQTRRQSQTLREILNLEPSKKEPLAEMEETISFNQLDEFEMLVSNMKDISEGEGAKLLSLFQKYLYQSSSRKTAAVRDQNELKLMKQQNEALLRKNEVLQKDLSTATSYTLHSMSTRGDLYFFSGFQSEDVIRKHIVLPLQTFIREKKITLRSRIPLEDRITWLFMWMWLDLSIVQLLDRIKNDYINSKGEVKTDRALRKLLDSTASTMALCFSEQIKLPSVEEWHSMNIAIGKQTRFNDTLTLILDGTSLPIRAPSNHRGARATYVSYKKHNAYRYFIATALNGEIVYVSKFWQGRVTDATMYRESGLKEILEQKYDVQIIISSGISLGLALGGDKGYVACEPPKDWDLLITKSGLAEISAPTTQLYPEIDDGVEAQPLPSTVSWKRKFMTEWAEPRTVVEISVGIGKRWKKLSNGTILLKEDYKIYENCVVIAAHIANLIIRGELSDDPVPELQEMPERKLGRRRQIS